MAGMPDAFLRVILDKPDDIGDRFRSDPRLPLPRPGAAGSLSNSLPLDPSRPRTAGAATLMRRLLPSLALLAAGLSALFAVPPDAVPPPHPYTPQVAPASDQAQRAIARFRMPAGVQATVWAAEPLLANPVCFAFDGKGRCYVAETHRLHAGVTDNRGHMNWLDDDLASRTVADRVAMYHKFLKEKFPDWEKEHDRVALLEDTKGEAKADKSTVFADGFHHAADGIGAGLLAHQGDVYYTCIPDLWLLRDTDGDGKADVKRSLATGFGVHVAFLGHDLHGLRMGPDGRVYFSCGDRGLNVTTKEGRQLFVPDCGAVLRCEPDGSNLEVVATGLRNPQELAFDRFGNLFTGDNNSDSGDKARLVYVVEGGDSGWRVGYQYGTALGDRGPFNAEKIWHLPHDGQPAYVLPPIAHIADGPSGLCYNPGVTALPEKYADHFFLADFRGGSGASGVRSFAVKPKGASFEMVDQEQFIWGVLATDCDFGPDGAFYISDWTEGWNKPNKGRIYRFGVPEKLKDPTLAEVKNLLAAGFDQRPVPELVKLLDHPDMRVRQEAQFALAAKGKQAIPVFAEVAKSGKNQLARLHAIWGLGQVGRRDEQALAPVLPLLKDADPAVRIQAVRVLEGRQFLADESAADLLKDADPRVRFEAALALAKALRSFNAGKSSARDLTREAPAVLGAVLDLLRDNADRDPYLRHAGVMALAASGTNPEALATDPSPAVRMAALLALRRLASPQTARFLSDADPKIVAEAARAIHDAPIPDALPQLSALVTRSGLPEPILLRALDAHYRLGLPANAAAIATFAARSDAPDKLRIEAVKMLGAWAHPPRRDWVTGLTQSLPDRPAEPAADALRPTLGGILTGSDRLRQQAVQVAARLGIKEVGPSLLKLVGDAGRSSPVRVEALRGLAALKDPRLDEAVQAALTAEDARLRATARKVLAKRKPEEALKLLAPVLETGAVEEKQAAFETLGDLKGPAADQLLVAWLDRLKDGQVPAEVRLELLEAAGRSDAAAVKQKLVELEAARPKNDHLAAFREALAGGDAEAGRQVFLTKDAVACLRCHAVGTVGGEVGPRLDGIGGKQSREYLLESLVEPNRQIAKGFETVIVTLTSGKTVTGVLKSEDDKELRLMTAEGQPVVIPKSQIDERSSGPSAMPNDLVKQLTKRELRDLVEFLANLK
jgi:quinoprotein glucose dehydrogenase